jgi:hypothetical protein
MAQRFTERTEMRTYALLAGVLFTAGSASVAQLAVASAGFERLDGWRGGTADSGPVAERVWYGGVLTPVTIDGRRAPPPAIALHSGSAVAEPQCARPPEGQPM